MTTNINLVVNEPEKIGFALDKKVYDFDFDTKIVTVAGDPYLGEYEVTPSFEQQTLATSNKYMSDDVTVYAIEVSTVSNPSGGNTVYIGGIF